MSINLAELQKGQTFRLILTGKTAWKVATEVVNTKFGVTVFFKDAMGRETSIQAYPGNTQIEVKS